ncbi:MAG: LPS export ABC transporter permease LptG [Alphaproteobacteria bacterium]|jgi:lipopolysaccharide export system permease protein|nr:LPS export ABC transporter permease LptG [Alphaproteobacteria bacterium]
MRLSSTLSAYISRQFLIGIGIVLFALTALILVFDLVELARRAASSSGGGTLIVVKMALLHLPYMAQRVVPYAVLIGVMLTLARMTRTSELVVARASGTSVWQFLLPGLGLCAALGIFLVTVFNPLAAALLSRYEQLDAKHIRGQVSNLAVSTAGLWLRQADAAGESVIHALRITEPELTLHDVIIFRYEGSDRFVERIDADTAKLEAGHWLLRNALITGPDRTATRRDQHRFETHLTIGQIQDSFASPETLSFWQVPGFIALLERAGFSALKHRVHWHSVLAGPLLLCAMVLIGASFSLRMTARQGGAGLLITAGVFVGFLFYVFSDIVMALGISASIPVVLAGWSPGVVAALLGVAMLLHIEDS